MIRQTGRPARVGVTLQLSSRLSLVLSCMSSWLS